LNSGVRSAQICLFDLASSQMQIPKIKSARLPDLVCAVLLLLFALAIACPRWRAGIDWRDEGLLAYGAVRAAQGEIPHRDFVRLQPPLSFYTTAGVFKLYGTSLASLRIFGLSIFLLLPLLIYGVGRSFTGPLLAFAAAAPACILGLPYYNFVPLAVWQGIAASLAAMLFLVPAALSQQQWLALPAGLLTAVSLFLRHDQAIYTIASVFALVTALSFARHDSVSQTNLKRVLLFWLIGVAIVFIPSIVVWWKLEALPEMFRQLILFPINTYRRTSSLPFPKLMVRRSVLDTATVLLFYIPLVVQAIAALYLVQSILRRRFHRREAILSFLIVWSALFYLQVVTRSDLTHLLITFPPLFLLTAFGWSIVRETMADHRTVDIILSSVFASFVISFLWILRSVELPDVTGANEQLTLERGGVCIQQARVVVDFVQRLQSYAPPTRSILALPYQPMFYFLCQRRNPTRWNYLWPGDQTPRDHERLIDEAERDPPAVVLLSEQREVVAFAPAILKYVEEKYIRNDDGGNLGVYIPREPD
jgi:hypothetical protein